MSAKSILTIVAALTASLLMSMPSQAMPALGLGDAVTKTAPTRASIEVCEMCQVVQEEGDDDEDEGLMDLF